MKYYSDITKKVYETPEALEKAEAAAEEKKKAEEKKLAARAARAKEVETAFKDAHTAQVRANELLEKFTKDYGSFHMTMRGEYPFKDSLLDYFLTRF